MDKNIEKNFMLWRNVQSRTMPLFPEIFVHRCSNGCCSRTSESKSTFPAVWIFWQLFREANVKVNVNVNVNVNVIVNVNVNVLIAVENNSLRG